MRICSILNKLGSLIILLIFTYTSCNYFSYPEILPSIHTVPVGLGDVGAVFLDENYNPTTVDTGILGMFVENNKYAENVMVIAEIPENHIDNNPLVRIINRENNSLVTFFYNEGMTFPHKMLMTQNGQTVTGRFSNYNILTQTYSVLFIDEDEEESELVNNLFLNRNIFFLHEKTDELTATQNERLQKIYTTLGLWASLAIHLEDFNNDMARSIKINLKDLVVGILLTVAAVALVVAIIYAPPSAIVLTGPMITIGLTGISAIAGAISVVSAGAALACELLMPDDLIVEIDSGGHKGTPPNENRRPYISITYFDETLDEFIPVQNNQYPPFYLEHNESITFYISITNYGSMNSNEEIINLVNPDNILIPFDPNYSEYISFIQPNAMFFGYDSLIKFSMLQSITITRDSRVGSYGDGGENQGRVKFILPFLCNVIINDNIHGVEFIDNMHDQTIWGNLFIFNFTVIQP